MQNLSLIIISILSTIISSVISSLGYIYPNLDLATFLVFMFMWIGFASFFFIACKKFYHGILNCTPRFWFRVLRIIFVLYVATVANFNFKGLLIVFPIQSELSYISTAILGFQIFLSLCLAFSPFVNIFTKRAINIDSNITGQLNGD